MQLLTTVSLLATLATAYDLPDNLAEIYKNQKVYQKDQATESRLYMLINHTGRNLCQ